MLQKPEFTLVSETGAGGTVVVVAGELDSGTCEAVEKKCREALDQAPARMTLDLERVSFIDSAGMRTMIQIERQARERNVSLVVLPPPDEVTALLQTAGLAERLALRPRPPSTARSEFVERVELELPSQPMSPSRARAEVRELVGEGHSDAEVAMLVLLTSEVVTNAVVHPRETDRAPIGLRVITYTDGVRVEVEDSGTGFDLQSIPQSPESGGRGLFLVDSCAASWGTTHLQSASGPRFCVWFELEWSREPAVA